ncbi:MAG: SDR family oxidoreductase, partial [Pseudomonadota bacterium]|nr:SDR family oxidoreductase [Pseudomonadota bacterium]
LKAQGIEGVRLRTSHAFHSAMLEPVLEVFAEQVAKVALKPPQIPYLSNLTGGWITPKQATDPHYWTRHLRQTVRFADNVRTLCDGGDWLLLEAGPGALAGLVRQGPLLASLPHPRQPQDDQAAALAALGRLWLAGAAVDWEAFHGGGRRLPLPTYPFQRRRYWIDAITAPAAEKSAAADWFYLPSWKRSPLPHAAAAGGPWLVFVDDGGLGNQLLQRLRNQGCIAAGVTAGAGWAQTDEQNYVIDPRQGNDYHRLLDALNARQRLPRTIIHCWSAGDDESPDLGFYSLLHLAQALDRQDATGEMQLLAVSTGLQDITGGERLCPLKATLLGPVRVIGQEYPHIRCRSIDVTLDDGLAGRLLHEASAPASDQVIAWRGRHRWAQTYEPVRLEDRSTPRLREQGVYLLTGGLGNIGLLLAEHLAGTVRARLVLTGRSAFPARSAWDDWLKTHDGDPVSRTIRRIRALEAQGAAVRVVAADAADREQMQAAVAVAERDFGALHGVIHAAGVVGEAAFRGIADTDKNHCEDQFQAKVHGVQVLEEVLGDRPLDFCLLCSSLSAVLGGLGFVAYAAANAFMDALVQRHNRHGVPWLSVNWDGWRFTDDSSPGAQWAMSPEEGVAAFQRLMADGRPFERIVVSTGPIDARRGQWTERTAVGEQAPVQSHARPDLPTAYAPPRDAFEQTLADIWRQLLGVERIGIDDDFFALGGHSLLATQALSRIQDACG